ncbi:transposable element Tcb2 transposase [Trichonephila clavipes]|nr:transposable element Tcb2 transposase [Trichonephila clavipes]
MKPRIKDRRKAKTLKSQLLELNVYQVLPPTRTKKKRRKKLLESRRVSVHSTGWEIFSVKEAVAAWIKNNESNLGLSISIRSLDDEPVPRGLARFARGNHSDRQPLLVLFVDDNRQSYGNFSSIKGACSLDLSPLKTSGHWMLKDWAATALKLLQSMGEDLEPFLETGSAGRRPGEGRRRATTPNEDRYLVLTARRHRNMNATLLQQHLHSATGTTVSTQTARNRLHVIGLYACRPMVCVRLTSRRCRDRREWATEHVNWRRNELSNVLFSDESRFSVHPDNRRIFIWRDRGILYIIRDGPLTAHRYRDEILRPIVVPYAAAIGDDFILMDDNCRPHRANLMEDFLFEEGIVRMEWPACSPYMNPIEHVWDSLGRRVAGRKPLP